MESLLHKLFSPGKSVRIGFEDILVAIQFPEKYIILNTLPAHEQSCLICGTTTIEREESAVNEIINTAIQKTIVVYGKHSGDDSPDKKQRQLLTHGLTDVLVYSGGLFEWLLLQDIYGKSEFPTTSYPSDLLLFRQKRRIDAKK